MRHRSLLLVLLCLPVAGASLGADTYPRQPLDVEHYRFGITLTDATDRITGEATVRLRLTTSGVTMVALDLASVSPAREGRGMTVESVTSVGHALAFTHAADRIVVTLAALSRNVIIHEIAHQWFGNAVTERDWNDVWLSEGFATYFTLLFIEHAYGRDEFADGLRRSRRTVLDFDAKTPDYRVVHDNLDDMSQVTTGMTYQKGAWVLHMLRQRVGDDRFWAGIRAYYRRFKDADASTADFREAMEQASGEDLSSFFQEWLYRGGVPRLAGTWSWDRAAQAVTLELRQVQPGAPFRVTVEVAIQTPGAPARLDRVEMTSAAERPTFQANQEPAALVLDPNVRLLAATELLRR